MPFRLLPERGSCFVEQFGEVHQPFSQRLARGLRGYGGSMNITHVSRSKSGNRCSRDSPRIRSGSRRHPKARWAQPGCRNRYRGAVGPANPRGLTARGSDGKGPRFQRGLTYWPIHRRQGRFGRSRRPGYEPEGWRPGLHACSFDRCPTNRKGPRFCGSLGGRRDIDRPRHGRASIGGHGRPSRRPRRIPDPHPPIALPPVRPAAWQPRGYAPKAPCQVHRRPIRTQTGQQVLPPATPGSDYESPASTRRR